MLTTEFNNIIVKAIACTVPMQKIVNEAEYSELFGERNVKNIIKSTGIKESYRCPEEQTVCDLGYVAAKELMERENIDPVSIDILLFVSGYGDYIAPATAFVLQKRLSIGIDCIAYDINLGCSGFLYGIQAIGSMMQCSNAKRALLIVGDSTSKSVSPMDKSRMLFGDAGGAIIIEKKDNAPIMRFALRSDGNRFKNIIIPAGGYRKWEGASKDRTEWFDGNTRCDYDLFMNGTDVFNFSITDVPDMINEFMSEYNFTPDNFDCLLLHQANKFILKHLAHKANFSMDKVPISLDRYGNSSATTIPVTLCDSYANGDVRLLHTLMCSYGIGLSWGVAEVSIDTAHLYPIIHTDNVYDDPGITHE